MQIILIGADKSFISKLIKMDCLKHLLETVTQDTKDGSKL